MTGITQEEFEEALKASSASTATTAKDKGVSQEDFEDALSSVRSSTFEDEEGQRVKASQQQEGEGWMAFTSRHLADSFERGVVSSVDFAVPDDLLDKIRGESTRGMDVNQPYLHQNPTRFMDAQELKGHRNYIRNFFFSGDEPLPPTSDDLSPTEQVVRFVSAGTEAASDMTNLANTAPRIAYNMAQSILPAAVADTVILHTSDAIASSDLSSSTKQNVLISLGVLSGVATGVAQSPITAGYQAYKSVKNINGKGEVSKYLKGEQKRFADAVVESQGDFYNIMERAQVLQTKMGGEPLKIVPIVAALQNDIMKGKFLEYYSDGRDPVFRAKIDEAVSEFVTRQDAYLKQLAVSPEMENVKLPKIIAKEQEKRLVFEEKRQAHIEGKIQIIDEQMSKLTTALTKNGSKTDIGMAAKGLLDKKRALVRQRFNPMYAEWKKTATDSGVTMPSEQVSGLLDWVNNLPTDEGRFLKNFSPLLEVKTKTKTKTTTEQGLFVFDKEGNISQKPDVTTTSVVDEYTPADVLNLKNTVNGRIRDLTGTLDSKGKVQLRLLNDFKGVLNQAIDEMPNGYGTSLRNIDLAYYTEMGIPFNSAGVSKMSVNKFTSTVAQDLTKLQNARDFLGAAGEDGVPVLKDAIYTRIHSKAIKSNDIANEKSIMDWLADEDNAALVDLVPNLRDELTDGATALSNARAVKARLEVDYRRNAFQATDDFLEAVGRSGLDSTVASLLKSDGASMDTILPLFKHMDAESTEMFKTGIRLKLVDRALNFKKPNHIEGGSKHAAVDYINANREVYTEFFGGDYMKNIEGAMEMFDIVSTLQTSNVPFRTSSLSTELLQKELGVGVSGITSAYRRTVGGVVSPAHAATGLGSRMAQSKLDAKRSGKLMDLLFNPSIVSELAREYKNYKAATKTEKLKAALKGAGNVILRNSLRGSYIGGREAVLDKLKEEEK